MGNLVGSRLGQMVRKNFVVESHLPLIAQISYIHQKPTAKAWNWYQRWLWRNGTRISVWNNPSGNTGLPSFSDVLLLLEIVHWNDSKNRAPFTFQLDFSETFGNGQQPFSQATNIVVFGVYLVLRWLSCTSRLCCILWSVSTFLSTVWWWLQEFPS